MLQIKVLGTGCPNCKKLAEETQKALTALKIKGDVEKVTDFQEIMAYDVFSTPGLVINGEVVSSGRIPSREEISSFLTAALERR